MSVFVSFISFGILLNNVAPSVELDRTQLCSILLGLWSPQSFLFGRPLHQNMILWLAQASEIFNLAYAALEISAYPTSRSIVTAVSLVFSSR
jgi:hypothetical protein